MSQWINYVKVYSLQMVLRALTMQHPILFVSVDFIAGATHISFTLESIHFVLKTQLSVLLKLLLDVCSHRNIFTPVI